MKFGMRLISLLLTAALILGLCPAVFAAELEISAPSALLMEYQTGEVLFEQNPDERLPIASVTKVMTMLLACEALQSGKINLDEMVTASDYACSMGGSQVYLEPGEQMSVSDMLKAIAVASGNDAAVAIGEHIMGSNSAFVDAMNERAQALGMTNTHFINCNGLEETADHYSSARDVAIMSRELLKHDVIRPYLGIWMDSLRDGQFALSNTNKLIRFYDGAIGIKTGSTSTAKYCLSAAAQRNGLTLIAVVLAAPTTAERFEDAKKLLDYGFANYEVKNGIKQGDPVGVVKVEKGKTEQIEGVAAADFSKLLPKGQGEMEQEIVLPETVAAPVAQGAKLGVVKFKIDGQDVGQVDIITQSSVEKISIFSTCFKLFKIWTQAK